MAKLGLIVGPALASLLIASHMPHNEVWRILLGIGAIPAACVFYLRRTIKESPHYKKNNAAPVEVSRIVSELVGYQEPQDNLPKHPKSLFSRKWLTYLFATAGAWFALDVVFYGNGVSSVLIINSLQPSASLLAHTLISALIFLVFAVPGYFLAAKFIDRIGRVKLQTFGFYIIALCYASIAFIPSVTTILPLFILIFGVSFFFVNFGPNSTTFLIPAEIFPSRMRAKAHGISAAIGKLGAFIGAFFLPIMLHAKGLNYTLGILAFVAVGGSMISFILPEMKRVSLDQTEQ